MKKCICLLLLLLLAFALLLTSCEDNATPNPDASNTTGEMTEGKNNTTPGKEETPNQTENPGQPENPDQPNPPAHTHEWGVWTVSKAASCTEEGTETRRCSACNETESRTIAKTAHTPAEDAAVPATCTSAGKTAGSHCSVCNTVLKAQETTPALTHDYQVTLKKPSFTENGYTLHTCSHCGDTYKTDEVPKLNAAEVAKNVLGSFGSTPDVFDFLPEAFSKEKLAGSDFQPDYSTNTPVSTLPTQFFGKQLNVIYGTIYSVQDALDYVDTVYRSADGIAALYMEYLNTNPANTAHFEGNLKGFSFVLDIFEDANRLTVSFGDKVKITLSSSGTGCTGEVRIVGGNVLKYESGEKHLKLAVSIFGTGMVQLEFVRDPKTESISGYLYEYLTVSGKDLLAASSLLTESENYLTIIGTKGDFCSNSKKNRNMEVYDRNTAKLLMSKVFEEVSFDKIPFVGSVNAEYYTYWVPITDLSGITSIRKESKINGKNMSTVYINGSANPFEPKMNTVYKIPTSRWFDIEFKTVYSYRMNSEGKLEKYSYEIPMFFVQKDHLNDFASELYDLNKADLKSTPQLLTDQKHIAFTEAVYPVILETYNTIKEAVTREQIAAYLGITLKENEN